MDVEAGFGDGVVMIATAACTAWVRNDDVGLSIHEAASFECSDMERGCSCRAVLGGGEDLPRGGGLEESVGVDVVIACI